MFTNDDLVRLKTFQDIIKKGSFELKGDAVVAASSFFRWFWEMEIKIKEAIAEDQKRKEAAVAIAKAQPPPKPVKRRRKKKEVLEESSDA